jgi:hypothetical protein
MAAQRDPKRVGQKECTAARPSASWVQRPDQPATKREMNLSGLREDRGATEGDEDGSGESLLPAVVDGVCLCLRRDLLAGGGGLDEEYGCYRLRRPFQR